MHTNFESNAYLSVFKTVQDLNYGDDFCTYTNYIGLEYDQGIVTRDKFQVEYSPDGWFMRKIVAIPQAAGGIIKTIFHLSQTLIWVLPNVFSSDNSYLRSRLFYVRRDLQEVKGWVISLFDDMKGQFHIQESQFHKTCYDYALKNIVNSTVESINVLRENDEIYKNLIREQLKSTSPSIALETIKKIKLDSSSKFYFYLKIARDHLEKKEYNEAIKVIDIEVESPYRNNFLYNVAQTCIGSSEYDIALIATQKIPESAIYIRDDLLPKIASGYASKNNLESAEKTVDLINNNPKESNPILLNIASKYFYDQKDPNKALNVLLKTNNTSLDDNHIKQKDSLLSEIAEHYLNNKDKDYDQAFKAIKEISNKNMNDHLITIANNYLENNELAKAEEAINQIQRNSNVLFNLTVDNLLIELAKKYLYKKDLDKAKETIGRVRLSSVSLDSCIIDIADEYYNQNKIDTAFELISSVHEKVRTYELLIKLAHHFRLDGKKENYYKALKEAVRAAFLSNLHSSDDGLFTEMWNQFDTPFFDNFIEELTKECENNAKDLFNESRGNLDPLMLKIKETARQEKNIEKLRNLKKQNDETAIKL